MLQSLELPEGSDYVTFPWLGNTGSVALPITLALAAQEWLRHRRRKHRPARHRQRDQLHHGSGGVGERGVDR